MKTYIIEYEVGNSYRTKEIKADSIESAVKKAHIKNVLSVDIKEYQVNDPFALRDF